MAVIVTTDKALIRDTLRAWLESSSGLGSGKVVWLNQGIDRPAKPYAAILIGQGVKTGTDDVVGTFNMESGKIEMVTAGPRTFVLTVEIYSNPSESFATLEADEILEDALLSLDTEAVRELFRSAKIGLLNQTPVSRVDDQLGGRWERRAVAELTVSCSGETFDNGLTSGNWIETTDFVVVECLLFPGEDVFPSDNLYPCSGEI